MSSPHDTSDTVDIHIEPVTPQPERSSDTTATDLRVPLPDYLQEVRTALDRAESAYASGDWKGAAEAAAEGLAMLRLSGPARPVQPLPPQYEEFFRCFQIQPQYRQALALFKQAVLGLRPARRAANGAGADLLRRAWELLGPVVAGMRDDLPTQTLVYEYPVAGRLLRGVTRLRHRLQAAVLLGSKREK
jgi:hypothetical protein